MVLAMEQLAEPPSRDPEPPGWADHLPDLALEAIAREAGPMVTYGSVCRSWRAAISGAVQGIALPLAQPATSRKIVAGFPHSTKVALRWDPSVTRSATELNSLLREHAALLSPVSDEPARASIRSPLISVRLQCCDGSDQRVVEHVDLKPRLQVRRAAWCEWG